MQFYNPDDPKGGAMAQWFTPKYAPVHSTIDLQVATTDLEPRFKKLTYCKNCQFSALRSV